MKLLALFFLSLFAEETGTGRERKPKKMTGGVEDSGVTLDELKKKMAEFARERDWDQFHSPRNLLLALVKIPF